MSRRKFVGGSFYSNCLFVALSLFVRGRLSRLLFRRTCDFPYLHIQAMTKLGNVVHFTWGEECWSYPVWFYGDLEVFRFHGNQCHCSHQ